jgi:hypothetical protein
MGCSSSAKDGQAEGIVGVDHSEKFSKVYCEGGFVACLGVLHSYFEYPEGMHYDNNASSWDSCFFDIAWTASSPVTLIPVEGSRVVGCGIRNPANANTPLADVAWVLIDCRNGGWTGTVKATATDAKGKSGSIAFAITGGSWSGASVTEYTYCSGVDTRILDARP